MCVGFSCKSGHTEPLIIISEASFCCNNLLFRCGKLKRLVLNNNRLITLPDILHLLPELEVGTVTALAILVRVFLVGH